MSPVITVQPPICHTRPFWNTGTAVGRSSHLPFDMEIGQRLGLLSRHVNAPNLPTLWGCHLAVGIVSLDQQETALEIDIAPLEREELAEAEAGSDGTQKERVIPGGVTLSCGQEERDLFTCEWVDLSTLGDLW